MIYPRQPHRHLQTSVSVFPRCFSRCNRRRRRRSTWILHCTETFLPAPLPPALIFPKGWGEDAGHGGDRAAPSPAGFAARLRFPPRKAINNPAELHPRGPTRAGMCSIRRIRPPARFAPASITAERWYPRVGAGGGGRLRVSPTFLSPEKWGWFGKLGLSPDFWSQGLVLEPPGAVAMLLPCPGVALSLWNSCQRNGSVLGGSPKSTFHPRAPRSWFLWVRGHIAVGCLQQGRGVLMVIKEPGGEMSFFSPVYFHPFFTFFFFLPSPSPPRQGGTVAWEL